MNWIPTVLPLMADRRYELLSAVAGLRATGIPLVGLNGSTLRAVGWGDSPGLYFFVPLLARATGLSTDAALLLFFGGLLTLALAAGACCWWAYARSTTGRVLGVVAMSLVCYWSLRLGDSYTLSTALPIGTVPPLLLLWRRAAAPSRWWTALVLTGLVAGVASLVRSEACLAALVFAAALTLLQTRERPARRAAMVLALVLATTLPSLGLRLVEHRRDEYLTRVVPHYVAPMRTHVIWHSIYIGFGFLNNDYGLVYRDGIAFARVAFVRPGTPIYTPKYDAVLRREVLRLVWHDPAFFGRTVMAKAGAIALYLLVFGNIGLLAALRARKPRSLDAAFAAALAAAALPGLLVVPNTKYLEGFTALTIIYALVSIDWALVAHAAARRTPAATVPAGAAAESGARRGVAGLLAQLCLRKDAHAERTS